MGEEYRGRGEFSSFWLLVDLAVTDEYVVVLLCLLRCCIILLRAGQERDKVVCGPLQFKQHLLV